MNGWMDRGRAETTSWSNHAPVCMIRRGKMIHSPSNYPITNRTNNYHGVKTKTFAFDPYPSIPLVVLSPNKLPQALHHHHHQQQQQQQHYQQHQSSQLPSSNPKPSRNNNPLINRPYFFPEPFQFPSHRIESSIIDRVMNSRLTTKPSPLHLGLVGGGLRLLRS